MNYSNPVIKGFNPDPSIVRVEQDFYLVTSSFEFFPGVPLYHSRNLADWERIGHCLTRETQLSLEGARNSGGIYAPTIRYDREKRRFYLVTTNESGDGNFIVHTDNIYSEWSDPVYVKQGGIDPSLLFDDGKTYFVSTIYSGTSTGIYLCEIDPDTGEMLTESRLISRGWLGRSAEAPHLYKIHGMYYLMLAEGGTEYGHMVTIGKSADPYGPYTPCPHNPILSHKDEAVLDISAVGHGDLVEDQNGNWWITALGIRPLEGRYMLHNLGRETFLAPVKWNDGWPVVNGGKRLQTLMEGPLPLSSPDPVIQYTEQGSDSADNHSASLSELIKAHAFSFIRKHPGHRFFCNENVLTLRGTNVTLSGENANPVFAGIRQCEFCCCLTAEIKPESLIPEKISDARGSISQAVVPRAGLSVYYNNEHHYDIYLTLRNGQVYAETFKQIYDFGMVTGTSKALDCDQVLLKIRSDASNYYLSCENPDTGEILLTEKGAAAALCTEITRTMTFTGTFFGFFAENLTADFTQIFYQT